jgi:16S rRNA processing protein RimM
MADDIVLAQVLGAHGVKGDVALRVYAEEPKSLLRYSFACGKLSSVKPGAKGVWIAHMAGVDTREGAEALKGVQLTTTRDALPTAPDGEYYIIDLIGLTVVADGQPIGRVTDAPDFGAGTLLDIRLLDGRSLYLPFHEPYVGAVDLAAGTIVVADYEAFV